MRHPRHRGRAHAQARPAIAPRERTHADAPARTCRTRASQGSRHPAARSIATGRERVPTRTRLTSDAGPRRGQRVPPRAPPAEEWRETILGAGLPPGRNEARRASDERSATSPSRTGVRARRLQPYRGNRATGNARHRDTHAALRRMHTRRDGACHLTRLECAVLRRARPRPTRRRACASRRAARASRRSRPWVRRAGSCA
jgi:hypothetical protein